jgi:hypothetical protein
LLSSTYSGSFFSIEASANLLENAAFPREIVMSEVLYLERMESITALAFFSFLNSFCYLTISSIMLSSLKTSEAFAEFLSFISEVKSVT